MNGIRSLIGFGNQVMTPSPFSALPPSYNFPRLYLDIFRGEPAITQFDWSFTPNHSSSKSFATLTGSGLHAVLPALHPGHD